MLDNKLPKLTYSGKSKSVVPIVSESELQTVTAEPWLEISDEGLQLEGLIFDREHNLFLCEVFGGKIFKVNLPSKDISVAFQSEKQNPAAVKIHKDGRLFTCYLGDFESTGGILKRLFQKSIQIIVLMIWYLIVKVVFISPTLEGIQRILKVASTTFLLILKR